MLKYSDSNQSRPLILFLIRVGSAFQRWSIRKFFSSHDSANQRSAVAKSFMLMCFAASAHAHFGGSGAFQPDANGLVVIETEHYNLNVPNSNRFWIPDYTPGYVGDAAMLSDPNSWLSVKTNIAATSPRMDYEVEYSTATNVSVWIYGNGPSGSRDSVWVGIDGDDSTVIQIDPTRAAWGWETDPVQLTIPAGVHTVNIWMREDGTIVDRLLLTPDASYTPTGTGPAESARGAGSGNGAPVAQADSFIVTEDSTSNVLSVLLDNGSGVDSDPDSDPLTITAVDSPGSAGGITVINSSGNELEYTPASGYVGVETFDYTISDGQGGLSSATVTVTVNAAGGGGGGTSGAYQPDATGQIVIEAEHYSANVPNGDRFWIADFTPGYVGDSAMLADPNSWLSVNSNIATSSPRMDYPVEYAASTSLKVWIRGNGPSGSRDSVWIGVDGDDTNVIQIDPTRAAWGWETNATNITVPAGVHTINIWMREDGTIVDRLLLTPDTSFTPSGDGPVESGQGGGGSSGGGSASVSYEYDALGRLIDVSYSDGSSKEFNYDSAGNRTSLTTTEPN